MSDKDTVTPDEGKNEDKLSFDLNFAPSWARTTPEAHIQQYQSDRYGDDDGGGGRHGRGGDRDRRPRRDFDDRDRRRNDRRPPRRDPDRKPGFDRDGGHSGGRSETADFRPAPLPQQQREERGGERQDSGRRDFRRPRMDVPELPLEVRVLPEQKALGAVIRRIQTSHRAYPLRDIAWLFLENPASCLIRVEPQKEQPIPLFQCKVCGMPALSEEEIRAHVVSRHMEDFFDSEEVACDPPSGSFVCVARCGLSGELLGPPNHHSYNAKVNEMLRTRYPSMSEEAYRSRIETVREPEVIEQWRQQCTKKTIYRRKGAEPTVMEPVEPAEAGAEGAEAVETEPAPKAPPMERDVAELVFKRDILPEQVAAVRHLICTAAVGMQTPSRPLFYTFKERLSRERRFPASLFFALRGAFRHRKLYLFRVNEQKGPDFVQLKQPSVLSAENTVQALRDVIEFVNEHPACTKAEMVQALAGSEEGKIKETLSQLSWLIEKGHVIEFYNDVLSAPTEYPAFRLLPGERGAGGESPRQNPVSGMTQPVEPQPAPAEESAVPAADEAAGAEASPPAEAPAEPAAEEPAAEAVAESEVVAAPADGVPAAEEAPEEAPPVAEAPEEAVAASETEAPATVEEATSDDAPLPEEVATAPETEVKAGGEA